MINTCICGEKQVSLREKHIIFTKGKNMANVTITLDDEDKKGLSEFCNQVGMTISGLFNVFTKQLLTLDPAKGFWGPNFQPWTGRRPWTWEAGDLSLNLPCLLFDSLISNP